MPIGIGDWKDIVVGMHRADDFEGGFIPARVSVEGGELSDFTVIRDLEEWKSLIPREDENWVNTPSGPFIIPKLAICCRYDKVHYKTMVFPSKKNIFIRDNFICQFTGKRLTKAELSVDHVIPTSRGGLNTWENMVTCDRQLNSVKSNRTPEEMEPPLKLINKPTKPKNGISFDKTYEDAWESFIQ